MILGRLIIIVVGILFVAWLVGRLMRDRTGR
jgi:flagellar biogenesis protein FliO